MPNDQTDEFIVELDSPTALDPSTVGSKAASVADLIVQGANVPPGFVVSADAFSEFVTPLNEQIEQILSGVDTEHPASALEASTAIVELLATTPMPPELTGNITKRLGELKTNLAVRSSATAEDLEGASFAGIYDTFLDATDAKSIIQRVRDVWASYYTGRAISYRERQNIPHQAGSMAVLIMELIDADAGGVLFTRDPRDGIEQILINAALGLGEGVVSGKAQADSFTLNSETFAITSRNVLDKETMIVRGINGSIDHVPVPADKRSVPALTDSQLVAVTKAAIKIKQAAGDDRDIEFVVDGDNIHILQSRPITTGGTKEPEFPITWDDPDEEKRHWVTHGHEPIYPLSIEYSCMKAQAERRNVEITGQYMARRNLKKLVNGYMYAAELDHDPKEIKTRLFKHHLQGRRYLEKRTTYYYEKVEPVLLKNLEELVEIRPSDNAPIPDHVANLRKTMRTIADHMNDLHWRSWAGFKRNNDVADFLAKITESTSVDPADLTLGLDHMTSRLTRRLVGLAALVTADPWLTNIFKTRDYETLFAHGNGKRPAIRKFRNRFNSMMKIWGCRNGIGYGTAWKATDPSWNMKPEIPLDSIGSFARQDIDNLGRSHDELRNRRENALRTIRKKIGRNAKLRKEFEFQLFRATHHIKMMENHNYLIEQRTHGEYRESIDRAGTALVRERWIDTADDIFFLRLGELEEAVSKSDYSGLRALIIQAKDEFLENSKLTRPDFIGTKPPEKEKDGDEKEPLRGLSEDGQTLHGEPSSAGSFTGTARVVITRTSTPPDIVKGEILVTENTGPDWVPVFPLLGGLILDGGDNFQHASLIAREYRIPCVIQTKEATTRIADAQLITLDGTAGTVTLNPMT